MEALWSHSRLALRRLMRTPGFTTVALIMLTAGIGANTAVFSVVNAVLLRSLPYEKPDRLVAVVGTHEGAPTPSGVVSAPDVEDYGSQSPGMARMGGVSVARLNLTEAGDPLAARVGRVTPGFFSTLGLQAVIGRLPVEDDFRAGSPAIAVLSHSIWLSRFGGRPDAIGTTVRLHGRPATVVGVLENDPLRFPDPDIALWIPLRSDNSRGSRNLTAVARLGDGASLEEAQRQLAVVARRLAAQYPESNRERAVVLQSFHAAVTQAFRTPLYLALACTAVVLLIMCANLGNMLLARTASRAREFSVRTALGAGKRHLARDLLLESAVLVLAGGAAGTLAAAWLADLFVGLVPTPLPRGGSVSVDGTVLAFAFAVSAATTIVATLTPALGIRERRLSEALKSGGNTVARSRLGMRAGGALVVAQVAFTVVLLVGAGLLLQSFVRLSRVDTGIATSQRAAFLVQLPRSRYREDADRLRFYDELTRRLEDLPEVMRVGAVSNLPLTGHNLCDDAVLEDGRALGACVELRAVNLNYFDALAIPLRQGRKFNRSDDAGAAPVALVNESLARRGWPDATPIGRRIRVAGIDFEIVGVIGDVRHFGPARAVPFELYAPVAQASLPWMTFALETRADPEGVIEDVRRTVWSLDPELPLREVATLDELLSGTRSGERFRAALVGSLSAVALALAALGFYGLLAFLVAGRTRELGIRMALGADGGRLVLDVLARAVILASLGLAVGLSLASLGTRALESLLFATSPYDPLAYVGSVALLLVLAVVAASAPARRAARVDPLVALRAE